MIGTEQKISNDINEIIKQLDEIIQTPYSYYVGVSLSSRKRHQNDTAVYITKEESPIAVIEITSQDVWYFDDEILFMEEAKKAGFSYGIMYCADWNEIMIQDLRESRKEYSRYSPLTSLFDLAEVLAEDTSDNPTQLDWKMGIQAIINDFRKKNYNSFELKALSNLQKAHILYDSISNTCYVDPKDERDFFTSIFIPYDKDYICRYTTFDALERILREKKQSVCSVVCMNDETECYYTDEYLGKRRKSRATKSLEIDYEELNKCQISSCTHIDLADSLPLWRLYADNGKGVCLKFKIDRKILTEQGFYLYMVNYANEDNRQWKLDLVAHLQKMQIRGYKFVFKNFHIWKHFFKPVQYRDEHEIRLLYFKNDKDHFKWIKTGDSQILAPVIEFNIEKENNEFPLILSEIILGPKFPHAATNIEQIRYYKALQQIKEEDNCPVTLSKIKGYR